MIEEIHSSAIIEIRILKRDDKYPVELQFDSGEMFKGYLKTDILPWVATASSVEDGARLFRTLFGDEVLREAWGESRGRYSQRRIRLRIDPDAPEIHAIPWELMHDARTDRVPQPVAADATTPFSRFVAGEWSPLPPITKFPIKLLIGIANPDNLEDYNLTNIDVNQERDIIQTAFSDIKNELIDLVFLDQPVTISSIAEALEEGPQLLHLVAHGVYSKKMNTASLYLADSENKVELVKDHEMAGLLQRLSQPPHLVFLASCQSATRNPADAFRGFAPTLIKAGVPAVLAMQDKIAVNAAREFTRTFYHHLFPKGQVDQAANQARSKLITEKLSGSGIPVLFSRLKDNVLFDVSSSQNPLASQLTEFYKGNDAVVEAPKPLEPLQVFLCHASADEPSIRKLYEQLHHDGFKPWLLEEDLLPGQEPQLEIPKAVRQSAAVLVCLSKQAVSTAGHVHKEIKLALDVAAEQPEGAIFIIPAKLEDCRMPERLRHLQAVNLFEQGGYDRLVRALAHIDGQKHEISPSAFELYPGEKEIPSDPVAKPVQYHSCFISYSDKDRGFAERLYGDLKKNGVSCWFAPHDMKIGAKIRRTLHRSIQAHDRVLLILSENAITSTWVESEVETAFAREFDPNELILFPIMLDDTIMDTDEAWAAEIRDTRHIGDFSRWKERDAYQTAFERLLRDLKAEG